MEIGLMVPSYMDRIHRLSLVETADNIGAKIVFAGESANSNVFMDLTEAALRTSSVWLGIGIANVYSRTPSLIALSVAEIDRIANGRAVLGLGPSTPELVEGLHGVPFDRPIARLSEYIELIRLCWTGDPLTYDGSFYSPEGGRLRTTPVQESPPIALAALGPRNCRLAGAKADVWLPHLVPKSSFVERAEQVHKAANNENRSTSVEVYAYVPTAIDEDLDQAYDKIRSHVATYAGAADTYREALAEAGYAEVVSTVHHHWKDGDCDQAMEAVTDELVEDVGLASTPSDAGDAAQSWFEVGVDVLVVNPTPVAEPADVRTALNALC